MYINSISDFRAIYRNGPFAWPGGYPMYFITDDGAALSWQSAQRNRRLILESIAQGSKDGWRVVAAEINWEDAELYCDDTGERIQSAYAEDDVK